jgi:nucleotidyltransferase/DNA polymerase involved in DNA repair
VGIYTVLDFYKSPIARLRAAFRSVNADYWYTRLRGWEADAVEFERKSFGNSYSIPQNLITPRQLAPILAKLVNKTASRLRKYGYSAYGIHVGVTLKGGGHWHRGERLPQPLFYTSDIFREALRILKEASFPRPVHTLSVTCYDLVKGSPLQLSILEDRDKKLFLAKTIDSINNRFGSFVLMTGNMLAASDAVKDRIAFGQSPLL